AASRPTASVVFPGRYRAGVDGVERLLYRWHLFGGIHSHFMVAGVRSCPGLVVGGHSAGEHSSRGFLHSGGRLRGLGRAVIARAHRAGGRGFGGHSCRRGQRAAERGLEAGFTMSDINWYVLGAIVILALCSLLTRAGYMVFGDYLPLPEGLRRALRYAPAAALVGIIIPEVLPWQPGELPTLGAKAIAAAIAILIYWKTRNSLFVIIGGMVAFWLIRPWWPY